VYHPKEWPLRLSVLNDRFEERDAAADAGVTDVAGPCCIQADIVAHQRMLPRMSRGDTVLLHDVGG
jgi:diaminopimelate decarboxylase